MGLLAAYNGPLIPDTSGQAWHYVTDVWANAAEKTVSLVQRFEEDSVYVAMRAPYTPKLAEAFAARLEGNALAQVITVGQSEGGRPLQMVKIGGGSDGEERSKLCVVMYAREHGNEQDTSWLVQGAIEFLISDDPVAQSLRERFTFLMIPMLDPDGAADGVYKHMTDRFFYDGKEGPEARAYAAFFKRWVDDGKLLTLAINLHNVESGEQPHLSCPLMEFTPGRREACQMLHEQVCQEVGNQGFTVAAEPWARGVRNFRLGGYLSRMYGALHMPYEANGQDKTRHLTLAELHTMGQGVIVASCRFLESPSAEPLFVSISTAREERQARINRYATFFAPESYALQVECTSWNKEFDQRRALKISARGR